MSAGLELRDAEFEDAEPIAAIYAPIVRDSSISFEAVPPGADELAARIAAVQERHLWRVAILDGRVVGWAYGTRWRARAAYDWTVETAVYVAADRQRTGIGRRLGTDLLERLEQRGYRSAVAGITLPNEPSRALHLALGYAPVGRVARAGWKFGRWHAVEFWERAIGEADPDGPPGP